MKIAITGATGQLGRLVIEKLKARTSADQLVALVRNPAKAADLGVEVREADYNQPATLSAALAGVEKLLLISSSEVGQRATQHHNVLEAARQAGVRHIIYTSVLHADTSPLSLAEEHRATEAELKASGVAYTLLRNGWYTENYTGSVPGAVAGGAFIGSARNGRISSATRSDFADAAVTVLTTPGHEGKAYELAGDDSYTLSELAAEISRQTGKNIPYRDLPVADYAAALAGFGIPEGFAHSLASLDADAAGGALYDDSRQLSRLIGRPTTPLSEAVAAALR
ncbi:SDR family oxidoreductase [Hymenobacter psychrotolerans]|uniref:NAD(P)H dehydrogenase (Quinone) n=1 Tax=Hymenobacter psychrotolerans DSM 18569 TaxID=1121959 RepID=A0A1M6UC28_9BACT|nr:SDR family oxidoreductase [Hymenobacter psychrotolerans]SHK66721.1 NAD(P)H dehydrogenase (quinone) [Hymenobacter psychrotolerans DSM 18569]